MAIAGRSCPLPASTDYKEMISIKIRMSKGKFEGINSCADERGVIAVAAELREDRGHQDSHQKGVFHEVRFSRRNDHDR